VRVLLLAGGAGTRLWPLSTEETPKQFLPLLSDRTLLAETYERLRPLTSDISVATSQKHAGRVRAELPEVPPARVLAEPCRRNSGPAVLSAALAFEEDGDAITAVIPSDQTVADAAAFRSALGAAAEAADAASVVVLGIPPTRPDTDFGYLDVSPDAHSASLRVRRYVEKPDLELAQELVRSGCLWNAGIFVFRPSRFLAQARRVAPDLVAGVAAYRRALGRGADSSSTPEAAHAYASLPDVSIDYAVMEKAADVRAIPLRAGWSDVGTWRAVRELKGASDAHGNLIVSDRPVIAPGISDAAIIVGAEGVLVLPFSREREMKGALEAHRREEESRNRG
jgi:mannose-1-phosphate guanylyltransferase